MNPRERILAAIRRRPVDRLPTDFWATEEVQERLFRHFDLIPTGPEESETPKPLARGIGLNGGPLSRPVETAVRLFDRLGIDGIFDLKPPYVGPPLPAGDDYLENEWGMGFRPQAYAGGAYWELVRSPLAEAASLDDLRSYRWPDPDWYDYSVLTELAERCGPRARCCGYTAPFYFHNRLRGLERSLMDPLLEPRLTRYLLERLMEFMLEHHRRCFEAAPGLIDMTQVTDDFGAQKGLLISPRVFDAFYRAPLQQAIDLAKAHGLLVFHHDDGDLRPLLPRLVEMGIDLLNPLQWRCGDWDLRELKARFGNRLAFHGGVDNQHTLPFDNPEAVRDQVNWLVQNLASDGTGFILAPCHNLQANTSLENILALYQAACEVRLSAQTLEERNL